MSNYPNYQLATNKAYETLIKHREFSFPIPVFSVLNSMKNICIHSYSEAADMLGVPFDDFFLIASSKFGFSVKNIKTNQIEIFYNNKKSEAVQRFTLAHELGHIILGHKKDTKKEDREANCFARNYLCPIPAVDGFNLSSPDEYCAVFFVSDAMASTAYNFRALDLYHITNSNYMNYNGGVIEYMTGFTMNDIYGYIS